MAERPCRLVLVRHAESQRNAAKKGSTYFADEEARALVRGIPDYRISATDEGRQHAERTGMWLRERFGTFDYAYHSGYVRTEQTLEGILLAYTEQERSRIKIRMNPFIRERDPGYTYDMTEEEAEQTFPWLKDHWKTFGGFFARPPGGESLSDVANRCYSFVNMLFRDRADANVLAVTHGGTLRCLRFLLERWDYERALKWPQGESPKNCGATVYEYDQVVGRLILKEYNSTCE